MVDVKLAAAREHCNDLRFDHATLELHGYETGRVSPDDGGVEEADVEDVFGQEYPGS